MNLGQIIGYSFGLLCCQSCLLRPNAVFCLSVHPNARIGQSRISQREARILFDRLLEQSIRL